MPEGDTIWRTARLLRPALIDRKIQSAQSRCPTINADQLVNRTVESIETRGKHLLMHLSSGKTIHSHMGMTGSWRTFTPSQTWSKLAKRAELTLNVGQVIVVCFSPKQLELLTPIKLKRHPWLSQLGPDILADNFDMERSLKLMTAVADRSIGDALVDQRLICGIGNEYKSEILFVTKLHPLTAVGRLTRHNLESLLLGTRELMKRNLSDQPRRTRFGASENKKWVYRRKSQPCLVCGTSILMQRQGELGRSSYWCPKCQEID